MNFKVNDTVKICFYLKMLIFVVELCMYIVLNGIAFKNIPMRILNVIYVYICVTTKRKENFSAIAKFHHILWQNVLQTIVYD